VCTPTFLNYLHEFISAKYENGEYILDGELNKNTESIYARSEQCCIRVVQNVYG
jgi:hypothetical protein